ncbi:MAG: AMP-binding protein [Chloroflexota bacterium]
MNNRLTGRERQRISLGELLQVSAEKYDKRPFITRAETGETLSYTAFNQLTNRVAHGLTALGIQRGDYVGIMLPNGIPFLAASYAMKKLGIVEVSINNTMRGLPLTRMINLTGCRTLITAAQFLDPIAQVLPDLTSLERLVLVDGLGQAQVRFRRRLKLSSFGVLMSDDDSEATQTVRDDETAVILFTSGTTGVSKGCAIPHRSSVRAAESMIEAFDLTEDDCVYSPYPLFHVGAAQYDVLPAMMVGGRAIIRDGFSLSNFWREVCQYGATWFMALGSVQPLLWAQAPCPEETAHQMRFFWGTPLPVDHDAFEARFNVKVARGGGYGSTDAGSVALPVWDKAGAGKVLERYEVAIVDEHDDILPQGAVGELVLRPREPAIMASEYIGMPDRTLKAWRNLWFHTGDLARLDEDGDLHWIARISERIRVKGEMVSGYEIEEGILTHPAIEDCAVIGIPDGRGEEEVKAFVTLRPNVSLTLAELRDYCHPRMSRFMNPTALEILAEMPRTPTGKPAKAELRKRINGS